MVAAAKLQRTALVRLLSQLHVGSGLARGQMSRLRLSGAQEVLGTHATRLRAANALHQAHIRRRLDHPSQGNELDTTRSRREVHRGDREAQGRHRDRRSLSCERLQRCGRRAQDGVRPRRPSQLRRVQVQRYSYNLQSSQIVLAPTTHTVNHIRRL